MLEHSPGGAHDESKASQTLGDEADRGHTAPNTVEAPPAVPAGRRIPWYRDGLLPATALAVLLIDQLSKYVIKVNLPLHTSWPREGFVRLTHGTNTGTAFGFFPGQTLALIVASLFAIAFLYYFYRSQALGSRVLRFAIGLQVGGAFGNLIDRLRNGAVVDFIDVGPWPIFNLADSSITVGIFLLISVMVLGKDGSSKQKSPDGVVAVEE